MAKPKLQKKEPTRLVIDQVQLEGKNPVSWKQFLQGYPEIATRIKIE